MLKVSIIWGSAALFEYHYCIKIPGRKMNAKGKAFEKKIRGKYRATIEVVELGHKNI